jgi:hypothetical protein
VAARPSVEEREAAARDLERLVSVVGTLQGLYFALAVLLCGLSGAMLLLVAYVSRGKPRGTGLYGLVVALVAGALAGVGAWDVEQRPRLWSILPAAAVGVAAVLAGADAAAAGLPFAKVAWFLVLAAPATALLWGASTTLRMGAILRSNPDLRAVRRTLRDRPYLPEGEVGRRSRERGRLEERLARRRILAWGFATALAAFAIGAGIREWLHPPLDPAVEEFHDAWGAADWDRIGGLFEPAFRPRMEKGLRTLLDRRGWTAAPPVLDPPLVKSLGPDRALVTFGAADGVVRIEWTLRDRRWTVTGLRLPE